MPMAPDKTATCGGAIGFWPIAQTGNTGAKPGRPSRCESRGLSHSNPLDRDQPKECSFFFEVPLSNGFSLGNAVW